MPDGFIQLEWDFIESIRAGRSVPIKRGDKVIGWMAEPRFEPILETKGFAHKSGLMREPIQLNSGAGKLTP